MYSAPKFRLSKMMWLYSLDAHNITQTSLFPKQLEKVLKYTTKFRFFFKSWYPPLTIIQLIVRTSTCDSPLTSVLLTADIYIKLKSVTQRRARLHGFAPRVTGSLSASFWEPHISQTLICLSKQHQVFLVLIKALCV